MPSLAEARAAAVNRIRSATGFTGPIVSEYVAYDTLPAIIIAIDGPGTAENLSGSARTWRLVAEFRTTTENVEDIDTHMDPTVPAGMAGSLDRAQLDGISLSDFSASKGVEYDEDDTGAVVYVWCSAEWDALIHNEA